MLVKNIVGVVGLLVLASCGEKSSDDRFEEICGIEWPSDAIVLKDQLANAGKDYGILYNVVLNDAGMKKYTSDIRNAKNFSAMDSGKNDMWLRKTNGYSFYLAKDGIFYKVEVDTTTNIVSCSEQG